jgi:hypothetical protein
MNYLQLAQAIKGYCENDFPETVDSFTSDEQIATFVQQAEQRIYNTVQLPALRKNVTGQTTSSNKYLSAPLDFLSVFSIAVVEPDGTYNYLLNKDVNFIREAYPKANDTGVPQYYALFGPRSNEPDELTFILGPTPDAVYPVELHYFYYPESIVTAGTSWLGDNFDSALLYGSLLEAYTFMKGEKDVIENYIARYNEALAMLKQLGDGKNRQDAYRNGQVRVPVR